MTSRLPVIINSRKIDGSIRRSWNCDLISRSRDAFVFIGVFGTEVRHSDLGCIKSGTVSYEYYWADRWYNIFVFHDPEGGFRNYYCNVCMPPAFENGTLDYVDLEIDIVVWPDWSFQILDEDEYAVSADRFNYSFEVRKNVAETVRLLLSMIESRSLPIPVGPQAG